MERYGMKIRCTAFKKYIDFLWGIKYNVSRDLKGAGRWQNAEGLR